MSNYLKPPVEQVFAHELKALKENDNAPRPENWQLSPVAVRSFILGCSELKYSGGKTKISQKFYGDDSLIERAVVTLATNRPLMLIGDPGTAKTMISELLSAAISGNSLNTIQGSVGTSEENIKYGWNYALLLNKGPSEQAMIKAPLYRGMEEGIIARFEEITRCPSEISDTLISVLSDKVLNIPELGDSGVLYARAGFNVIATANTRDKGINDLSSALKRRFNYETVKPIEDVKLTAKVVREQSESVISAIGLSLDDSLEYLEAIAEIFTDIRRSRTDEGYKTDKFNAVMSTAEAVTTFLSSVLDSYYFMRNGINPKTFNDNIFSTVKKDNDDDELRLKNYYDSVVRLRGEKVGGVWKEIYKHRPR